MDQLTEATRGEKHFFGQAVDGRFLTPFCTCHLCNGLPNFFPYLYSHLQQHTGASGWWGCGR